MNQSSWYLINNISELDSPALVVYPDRVRKNIRTAKEMIGDVQRLRPHVKTHKSPELVRMQMEEGIHKFKCATIAEAEMLAQEDAQDVLLAYQPVGPKLERFLVLIKKYPNTRFSCLVDNEDAATEMARLAEKDGSGINVFIDLNVGMN